jgi:hypothetical protein
MVEKEEKTSECEKILIIKTKLLDVEDNIFCSDVKDYFILKTKIKQNNPGYGCKGRAHN